MVPRVWIRARAATPAPVRRASPGLTVTLRSGSVTASLVATEATVWWVRKALSLLSHNTGFPVFVFASDYLRVQEDAIDCQVSRWPSSQERIVNRIQSKDNGVRQGSCEQDIIEWKHLIGSFLINALSFPLAGLWEWLYVWVPTRFWRDALRAQEANLRGHTLLSWRPMQRDSKWEYVHVRVSRRLHWTQLWEESG